MNILSQSEQLHIVELRKSGSSIDSISVITGFAKSTIQGVLARNGLTGNKHYGPKEDAATLERWKRAMPW